MLPRWFPILYSFPHRAFRHNTGAETQFFVSQAIAGLPTGVSTPVYFRQNVYLPLSCFPARFVRRLKRRPPAFFAAPGMLNIHWSPPCKARYIADYPHGNFRAHSRHVSLRFAKHHWHRHGPRPFAAGANTISPGIF